MAQNGETAPLGPTGHGVTLGCFDCDALVWVPHVLTPPTGWTAPPLRCPECSAEADALAADTGSQHSAAPNQTMAAFGDDTRRQVTRVPLRDVYEDPDANGSPAEPA